MSRLLFPLQPGVHSYSFLASHGAVYHNLATFHLRKTRQRNNTTSQNKYQDQLLSTESNP